MTGQEVIDVGRDAIWAILWACGPVMLVGLIVGLAIALIQALTQIQEMTLVFVPKIAAIFVTLILFMPLTGAVVGGLAMDMFARIAAM